MLTTHPIIDRFLQTRQPLGEILTELVNTELPLEKAFLQLSRLQNRDEVNQDFLKNLDNAINAGHPSSDLFLFFICQSVNYLSSCHQQEKAKSLMTFGESLISDKLTPFIKALFYNNLAIQKNTEGYKKECEKLMQKGISIIDKKSPRAIVLIQNYLVNRAITGRLKEDLVYKLDELNGVSEDDYFNASTFLKIVNCCVTGHQQEGLELTNIVLKNKKSIHNTPIQSFQKLLQFLSSNFNPDDFDDKPSKLMAEALYLFSIAKFDEAIKKQEQIGDNPINHMNQTISFLPLHYNLCTHKIGMAKWLLNQKAKNGDDFYLLDLFWGRLHLLENDIPNADKAFLRLKKNIDKFDAHPRLKFELQFAKELPLPSINKLIDGWQPSQIKSQKNIKSQLVINSETNFIGNSSAINNIRSMIPKFALHSAPVLITGETGTGKELIANALHKAGPNPDAPFLAINCGALTETLLQSELFGYEAGAFTGAQKKRQGIFEAAANGTVFLDEFGDISPKLQVSLLRVLESNEIRLIGGNETKTINCKIIVATNIDLAKAVSQKQFREDLYYRLSRFEITTPPLRSRPEDIPELINYFLKQYNTNPNNIPILSAELMQKLSAYHWPGNIRELKNEIERLCILNPGVNILEIKHFDFLRLKEIKTEPSTIEKAKNTNTQISEIIAKGFRQSKRQELLIALFKEHKKLTRSQVMKITSIGPTTATKDLQALIDQGLIIRRRPTSSTATDFFEWLNPTFNKS